MPAMMPATFRSRPERGARQRESVPRPSCPRSDASFWQPAVPRGAGLVCAEIALDRVGTHVHEGLLVVVPLAPIVVGDGTGREIRIAPDTIHAIPPFASVSLRRTGSTPAPIGLLSVAPAWRDERPRAEPGACSSSAHASIRDRALHGAVAALLDELRQSPRDAQPARWPLDAIEAVRSAARLERNAVLGTPHAPIGVRRLRALLQADPTRSLSLAELADAVSMSKFYLLRAFQSAYGLTPHGYQMQLRLARARRLIEAGRRLSFAAYDAGFADQSHLTRRFRDYFGLTPAVYARQVARTSAAEAAQLPSALERSAA